MAGGRKCTSNSTEASKGTGHSNYQEWHGATEEVRCLGGHSQRLGWTAEVQL